MSLTCQCRINKHVYFQILNKGMHKHARIEDGQQLFTMYVYVIVLKIHADVLLIMFLYFSLRRYLIKYVRKKNILV